jgi:hypothetical protein
MSDLIPSQFVSPSPRSELNGELGLDLHEIAKTMELEFSIVKRKRDELKKTNDINDTTICRIVKVGFSEREVESAILDVDNAKLLVTQLGGKLSIAFCKHLIQCEKKLEKAQFQLETLFTDPRKGAEFMLKVAELKEEKDTLAAQLPQLEAERDHAVKTKAHISDKKTATALVKLGNLVQYMKKRGIPVPPYAEIDSEEDYSERVQELEKLVKKLDTALEEYRRKENLQEEENQTYHPTSKNGIGVNDALRKWGLSLTTTNSREINASIRSYLINIGGEILWTDSTFKGAPSKRCVWHPQFLDKNKGRILNFLKNEGWLKKA